MFSLSSIKNSVETFLTKVEKEVGSDEHKLITKFVDFVEGNQKTEDAIELLTSEGYTVTAPVIPVQTAV